MRLSNDIFKDGIVFDGYDYDLQVWVTNGIIEDCGHPITMKEVGCCKSHEYAGKFLKEINEMIGGN